MASGSIRPRPTKDGKVRYRVKWESVGPDGSRRHHSATCRTKDAAEKLLVEKLGEVNDGTFVVASKETVESYLARWLEAAAIRLSGGTVYQYEREIRTRLLPHIGALPLAKLDEARIQGTYAKLLAAGYAPSTVDKTHRMLHTALKQAVAWRLLQRNPVDGVSAPRVIAAAPVVWTAEESETFLDLTADDPLAPLWQLGLDSGMRLGEMLALSWRDLDVERRVIRVQRTLTRTREGSWKIGEHAKTSSSRRAIALGSSTMAALRALRARQAERRLACGGG
jgi:integrase